MRTYISVGGTYRSKASYSYNLFQFSCVFFLLFSSSFFHTLLTILTPSSWIIRAHKGFASPACPVPASGAFFNRAHEYVSAQETVVQQGLLQYST